MASGHDETGSQCKNRPTLKVLKISRVASYELSDDEDSSTRFEAKRGPTSLSAADPRHATHVDPVSLRVTTRTNSYTLGPAYMANAVRVKARDVRLPRAFRARLSRVLREETREKNNVIVSVLKSAGDGRASATFRPSRALPGVSNPSFHPVQLLCLFRVAKPSSPRAQVPGEHVSEAEMPSKGARYKPRKKSRNALSGGTPPESRRARSPRRGARFLPAGRTNIRRRS